MLYRFCAGAAAADCAKCRGVLFLRFRAIGDAGPYRDVRNFGRGVLTDGPMCPAAVGRNAPCELRRGRCPHRSVVRPEYFFQCL